MTRAQPRGDCREIQAELKGIVTTREVTRRVPKRDIASKSRLGIVPSPSRPPLTIMTIPKVVEHEHEEYQYTRLIRNVLDNGETRPDRTGTGTIALFAPPSFRFSLADMTLPLLTTKRTFLRGIVEELLWFVQGCTDSKKLSEKGVKIWDGNGSKEFLEGRGLGHRREGDLGPVYGFQWRHFGAAYVDADHDYTGEGVDQIAEVIQKIKENPTDRRIILSAWNPKGAFPSSS